MSPVKIVGLEEHFVIPGLLEAWGKLPPDRRDLAFRPAAEGDTGRRLLELGPERIAAMDAIRAQRPGALADHTRRTEPAGAAGGCARPGGQRPARRGRLGTTGSLAGTGGASDQRAGRGRRGVRARPYRPRARWSDALRTHWPQHLDHADLWPVYEVAERRGAPLHLHPQSPAPAVRIAYYSGFGSAVEAAFATFGVGWHYDAGVEFLRMVVAGVFDRFPRLQVVVGHWGELVLFFLERIQHLANVAGLPRNLHDYATSNLVVAPSGILSHRYLRWALEVVGAGRIVSSTDYPFEAASQGGAQDFLAAAELSEHERTLVASGNWDRLRAGIVQ